MMVCRIVGLGGSRHLRTLPRSCGYATCPTLHKQWRTVAAQTLRIYVQRRLLARRRKSLHETYSISHGISSISRHSTSPRGMSGMWLVLRWKDGKRSMRTLRPVTYGDDGSCDCVENGG